MKPRRAPDTPANADLIRLKESIISASILIRYIQMCIRDRIRDILRLRLSRCRFVVEAVERVEDEDAATTADNEFAGFGKHTVGGGIAFQGDMGDILGEKLLGACLLYTSRCV